MKIYMFTMLLAKRDKLIDIITNDDTMKNIFINLHDDKLILNF